MTQAIQNVHSLYNRPIWLTEFCMVNYGATTPDQMFPTYAQQTAFMSAAVPALESLSIVERFAWYALFPDQIYANSTASLYDDSGTPTPAGQVYMTF